MSIMVFLGGALVTILKQGIMAWHTAEKRGAIYERSRMVLDQIAEDLRAAAGDSRSQGAGYWIRFICDTDQLGRPRLRFTRSISGEAQDPIARQGGKFVETLAGTHFDLHGDYNKVVDGSLLAPGGYQEVLYVMDPDPTRRTLWRGVRSPIGGAGSLFIDRNVEGKLSRDNLKKKLSRVASPNPSGVALAESPPPKKTKGKRSKSEEIVPLVYRSDAGPLAHAARPFAEDILYVSFAFWTPLTNTWDRGHPPHLVKKAQDSSGPISTWDSTRAVLDEKAGADEFAWRSIDGSLENPHDDLFPEQVEITLVVAGNAEVRPITLAADLKPTDKVVSLSSTEGLPEDGPHRFVWIDGEWIGYEKIKGSQLMLYSKSGQGRGARGTLPASHLRGAVVELGTTFRRIVEIPGARSDPRLIDLERRRR